MRYQNIIKQIVIKEKLTIFVSCYNDGTRKSAVSVVTSGFLKVFFERHFILTKNDILCRIYTRIKTAGRRFLRYILLVKALKLQANPNNSRVLGFVTLLDQNYNLARTLVRG
jgi:hypothetical protein